MNNRNDITKVEAIKRVLKDFGGIATWEIIYNNIEKYYPNAKQSIEWKAGIRGVLYREIKENKIFKKIDEGTFALLDYSEENLYIKDFEYGETERSIFAKIRIGQNKYREALLKKLKKCPITGIDEPRILVASHIKPWKISNDEEKLNLYNGLILSPTIDKLFDRGFITFTSEKKILISNEISKANMKRVGIIEGIVYDGFPIENRENFLQFHYENIFLKS